MNNPQTTPNPAETIPVRPASLAVDVDGGASLFHRLNALSDKEKLAVFHYAIGYSAHNHRRTFAHTMERAVAYLATKEAQPSGAINKPMLEGMR
jgi:hypothetical protein